MADSAYGLWPLVIVNTLLFVVFGLSLFHPKTLRDWRAMGAYTAFLVALFTEMYGFPLTIYLLGSWLGTQFPLLRDTHAGGHLWNDLIGWTGDPHLSPFHLASYLGIGAGFWLIAVSWRHLHAAAQADRLATTGPYAWVRHPIYSGLVLAALGQAIARGQWIGLLGVAILLGAFWRKARVEERWIREQFGSAYENYSRQVRAIIPFVL